MSKEKLLSMLKQKDQSVEKVTDQNPYSQDELHNHITNVGFPVEQTPDISAIADSLQHDTPKVEKNPEAASQDIRNHLTMLHKHLAASGKLPKPPTIINEAKIPTSQQENSPVNKQLNMEALKSIMARRRGK